MEFVSVVWRPPDAHPYRLDEPVFKEKEHQCFGIELYYGDQSKKEIACYELNFHRVVAYRCTFPNFFSKEMVDMAYENLVEVRDELWSDAIKKQSDIMRDNIALNHNFTLRHLMMFFDEAPCYEFVCAGFSVNQLAPRMTGR